MIKSFLKKYAEVLLEGYLASMCCYICMYTMDWNVIVTAVMIGFVNCYLLIPIMNVCKPETREEKNIFNLKRLQVLGSIAKSVIICLIMYFGVYYVVNQYLFTTSVEPITFGIIYEILSIGFHKIIKLIS